MTTLWMLDTNTVSLLVHKRSAIVDRRAEEKGVDHLRVSAISYAETRFGVARNPDARHLAYAVETFFAEVAVLQWTRASADVYGNLRAEMRRRGKALSPLDMLIASHALEAGSILVTGDRAFRHVPGLVVEDWTA